MANVDLVIFCLFCKNTSNLSDCEDISCALKEEDSRLGVIKISEAQSAGKS